MRVGYYLGRRFLGFLAFLCAVAAMLFLAVFASVRDSAELAMSYWGVAGPLALLAALWTARRTRALGERPALAALPVSGLVHALPVAVCAVGFQLLVALPQPEPTDRGRLTAEARIVHGLGGEILLRRAGAGVLFRADGELIAVELGESDLPADFYPEPERRAKLRRWLFFAWSPYWSAGHPLDPWLWRWLYIAWHGFAVLIVTARSGSGCDFGFLLVGGLFVLLL